VLITQLAVLRQRQKAAAARTVLVIDDSLIIRTFVALTLKKEGHRVLAAAGVRETLDRLNQATPDLILLDICFARRNGRLSDL
jgi:chemosensory pili system protein ChpA (sensor histidine kinase/response regulator)